MKTRKPRTTRQTKVAAKPAKTRHLPEGVVEFGGYLDFWHRYLRSRIYQPFSVFEKGKDVVVGGLYKEQGRRSRPMMHLTVMATVFFVVAVAPSVFSETMNGDDVMSASVLAANNDTVSFYTMQAEEVKQMRGGEVTKHTVREGETVESVAAQYGLKQETIRWENGLKKDEEVKPGQELRILPIDGIRHKVAKGETIQSIGKKYGLENAAVQAIVDFPFNEFVNDENFELAVGQYLMIPGGVKKEEKTPTATFASVWQRTPDAGTVSATGSFIWPASGVISQGYSFYHKAIDIAGGGPILAADAGVVTHSGWDNSGYGNRAIVDHGNGSRTLYAHMSELHVVEGQSVNRGDVLGIMGTTGRSTGVHLHFEVRQDSVLLNPLDYLR